MTISSPPSHRSTASSQLTLFVPPRRSREQWTWSGPAAVSLDYVLLDDSGQPAGEGRCRIDQLPPHRHCTLLLAATDVLALQLDLPPIQGARLSQALPGLLEERLLQDPAHSSFAMDPSENGRPRRHVAVIDKAWLQALQHAVTTTSRRPPMLAAAHWLHRGGIASSSPAIIIRPLNQAVVPEEHGAELELWIHDGQQPGGMLVQSEALASTLAWLTSREPSPPSCYWLHTPSAPTIPARLASLPALQGVVPLEASVLALQAREHILALSTGHGFRQQAGRGFRWQPLRPALSWLFAALACILLGSLMDGWRLQHQARQLRTQMLAVLHSARPDIKVVLDPARQLHQAYQARFGKADDAGSDHFLSLAAAAARALDNHSRSALRQLDYDNHALRLQFAAGIATESIQTQFKTARLHIQHDDGSLRWTVENSHAD